MKHILEIIGVTLAVVSLSAFAGQPGKLAPRVAAVYAKVQTGTLKTTDAKDKPRREPLGPRFNRAGQVEVDVHYRGTPPLDALKALGAKIEANVPALSTVELFIAPVKLAQAARLPGISRIAFPHYTFPNGAGSDRHTSAGNSAVDTNAMKVMHVDKLTQAVETSGKGIEVLVISTGADHIAAAAKDGVLPSNIYVDSKGTGTGDEGTSMLEIVHAIAPNARLGFCGPSTALEFLVCLNDEAASFNANIVVSDLYFIGVDGYHASGPLLTSFRSFLNAHPDLTYINGVGNSTHKFFEGNYQPSDHPETIGGKKYASVEDWGSATGQASDTTNTFTLPVGKSIQLELQWDDNWAHPSEDYQLFLMSGGKVLAAGMPQGEPSRDLSYKNSGSSPQDIDIVVACRSSACHRRFFAKGFTFARLTFQYGSPKSSADALATLDGVVSIGSVIVSSPNQIDPDSGRGPALHDGSIQPTFVAPDCVTTIAYGNFSGSTFCGTSAAAPQAAGVLALLESSPLPGGVQALIDGAIDLGKKGQDNTYGYGRIDAKAAEASLDTPPTISPIAAFTVASGKSHKGKVKGALSATAKQAKLALRYVITKKPAHGTVNLDAKSGAYTYTAASGYSGSDQFTCASNDGLTQSKQQTVAATVKPASAGSGSGGGGGGGASNPLELLGLLLLGMQIVIRRSALLNRIEHLE